MTKVIPHPVSCRVARPMHQRVLGWCAAEKVWKCGYFMEASGVQWFKHEGLGPIYGEHNVSHWMPLPDAPSNPDNANVQAVAASDWPLAKRFDATRLQHWRYFAFGVYDVELLWRSSRNTILPVVWIACSRGRNYRHADSVFGSQAAAG